MVLDKNSENFILHILTLGATARSIYFFHITQKAILQKYKTLTKEPSKYYDYINIFTSDLIMELPKNTSIDKKAIQLIEEK